MDLYTVNTLTKDRPSSMLLADHDLHVTDTLVVADLLGRTHASVLRAVENLMDLAKDPEWDLRQRIDIGGHRVPSTLLRDGVIKESYPASNGYKPVYAITKDALEFVVAHYGWPLNVDHMFMDAATEAAPCSGAAGMWERRADFLSRVPFIVSPDPRRPVPQEKTGLSAAGAVVNLGLADTSKVHETVFRALRRLDSACGIPTFEVFRSDPSDPLGMQPAEPDAGAVGLPEESPTVSTVSTNQTPEAPPPALVWGVRFTLRAWPGRPVDPVAFSAFVGRLDGLLASEQAAASAHMAGKRIAMAERAASLATGHRYGEQKAAIDGAVSLEAAMIEAEVAERGSLVRLTPLEDQSGNPPRLGNPFDQVPPLMVRGFPEEWQARLAADRMLATAADALLGSAPDPEVFPEIPPSDAALLALLPPEAILETRLHPAGESEVCVDMRVPHALVGVTTPYSVWVKALISRNGLVEGRDYAFVRQSPKGVVGKPREDYYVRHPVAAGLLSRYAGRLERGEPTRKGPVGPRNGMPAGRAPAQEAAAGLDNTF